MAAATRHRRWRVPDGRIRRRGGGARGLPAPVDVAVAGAGAAGPAPVQGRGEAVPDPHGQDALAGADRPRDRGRARPAAHPRGGARGGHGGHRDPRRHRRQPVAAPARRGGAGPVERPVRQAPRGTARARHGAARPLGQQPRADRGRPRRDRRRARVGADPHGRHLRRHRPGGRRHALRRHPGRCPVSTFSGLNAATTSLWAPRRALDVTGQNIANVNTEGYSRQRAEMEAMGGSPVPAFYSRSSGIGAGVNADKVIRIRDAFLEGRGHVETANAARLTAVDETYGLVEKAFREPGDTGIQSLMADMWAGWGDVANHPEDPAARGQVVQRLNTLVGGIQFSQAQLGAQWDQTRESLGVLVSDVNASAQTVAQLNQAIQQAIQSKLPANDLMDKRDLLVMKLADQIGATVRLKEDGVVDVVVGGISLVAGSTATAFAVAGSTDPDTVSLDRPRIVTAGAGYAVRPGGRAEGQLTALNDILPGYRSQLAGPAADLAASTNGLHTTGFDAAGNPGTDLLGPVPGPVTAANLTVLISDPALVAASSVGGSANTDNGVARQLANLRQSTTGTDAQYRAMIVELGVQASVSDRNLGIQQVITAQVDAARESVAGVNIDEEMTNMLSYQHAYAAAGRLVTAIDETLDVLINRTGLVGR